MSDHSFEKQVQQKLEELKISPSDSVWSSVHARIQNDKHRRRRLILFPILFLFLGAISYYLFDNYYSSSNKSAASKVSSSTQTLPVNEEAVKDAKPVKEKRSQNNIQKSTQTEPKQKSLSGGIEIVKNPDREETSTRNYLKKENKKSKSFASNYKKSTGKNSNRKNTSKPANREIAVTSDQAIAEGNETNNKIVDDSNSIPEHGISKESIDKPVNPITDSTIDNIGAKPDSEDSSAAAKKLVIADSIISATNQAEPKPELKKLKKAGLKWGLDITAGVSNIKDGGFLSGVLDTEKSLVADVADRNFSSTPNAPTPIIPKPSEIEKGFSFSIGAFIQKNLSRRFSVSTGIQYSQFSNKIQVGTRVDSSVMVQNAVGSLNVSQFYRPAPPPTMQDYTNKFHFIGVPFTLHTQLNKSQRIPITWTAGVSLSYLVSTNALHFDGRTGVYYEDNSLFNKLQGNLSTGFLIAIFNRSQMPIEFGPHIQYGLTNLLKKEVSESKRLIYFGLNSRFFINK